MQTKRGTERFERTLRAEMTADVEAGRDAFAGPPPTFHDFVVRWRQQYLIPHNRPSTLRAKESILKNHLLPEFGCLRLDYITTALIDRFAATRHTAGLAPKTINPAYSPIGGRSPSGCLEL